MSVTKVRSCKYTKLTSASPQVAQQYLYKPKKKVADDVAIGGGL
jgi:hypothetical protein